LASSGEVALLRDVEKGKVDRLKKVKSSNRHGRSVRLSTMGARPANVGSCSKKLSERSVKLFGISNCFFAIVLFNAGALLAARG
jgi:hypothetical protein